MAGLSRSNSIRKGEVTSRLRTGFLKVHLLVYTYNAWCVVLCLRVLWPSFNQRMKGRGCGGERVAASVGDFFVWLDRTEYGTSSSSRQTRIIWIFNRRRGTNRSSWDLFIDGREKNGFTSSASSLGTWTIQKRMEEYWLRDNIVGVRWRVDGDGSKTDQSGQRWIDRFG